METRDRRHDQHYHSANHLYNRVMRLCSCDTEKEAFVHTSACLERRQRVSEVSSLVVGGVRCKP